MQHVTSQNRPFNAQNVADALGRHGIKKGLAQKYLDQLAESGKIAVKDAGKQKVYFALQDAEVMSSEDAAAMETVIKAKTATLTETKAELQRKHARLRQLAKTLTVPQMKEKTEQLAKENAALEKKILPLRRAKDDAETEVSPELMRKQEDVFVFYVEQWASRKRKFNDALETILDSTNGTKKKMVDDIGFELDPVDAEAKLREYKKTVEAVKRKRSVEARTKKLKTNHP